jgi:hypothetical protein
MCEQKIKKRKQKRCTPRVPVEDLKHFVDLNGGLKGYLVYDEETNSETLVPVNIDDTDLAQWLLETN